MTYNVAINGYGRIGRNILRAFFESKKYNDFQIIAINDLADLASNAHLTKYDSVHGRFPGEIHTSGHDLIINGHKIKVSAERDPQKLPWKAWGIDLVLECTGLFASLEKANVHLVAGAKKVLISAPAGNIKTIVYGVNEQTLRSSDTILSNASCTTNCLAPIAKILHDAWHIESGLMVTVHSYTNDQKLTDSYHVDWHRARAAAQSMIPTKTGAASAVGLVLPELNCKMDGYAIRVPTINVSVVDLTVQCKKTASVQDIHQRMKAASQGPLKEILAYNEEPLVSIDFNHSAYSSIYDAGQTRVIGNLIKVVSWYDNEWGFSNRMLDVANAWLTAR